MSTLNKQQNLSCHALILDDLNLPTDPLSHKLYTFGSSLSALFDCSRVVSRNGSILSCFFLYAAAAALFILMKLNALIATSLARSFAKLFHYTHFHWMPLGRISIFTFFSLERATNIKKKKLFIIVAFCGADE